MTGLTDRQRQIFELIRQQIQETGFPPTRAEIAKELGFRSANAAEEHLKALERKGIIEIVKGISRGIRLKDEHSGIPVVGEVAAGQPILAKENVEDYLPLDPGLFNQRADFFLRVRGDSMRDAGILSGDLLAVKAVHEAPNGSIVVARIDDDVTVKRLHRRGKRHISLEAANEDYPPIEVDLTRHQLAIEGIAVGILRTGFSAK